MPLITTMLGSEDCKALSEKILAKVQSWSTRLLSYGGRAQLTNVVIFSAQVYWSSLLIIPQKVSKEVESTLRAFCC